MTLRAEPDLERARQAVVASHLQRLVATEDWDVFLAQVAEVEQQHLQALAKAPLDDVIKLQGRIEGIREVLRLPQTLIAHARRP
jgi:putative heme iron utilization protein